MQRSLYISKGHIFANKLMSSSARSADITARLNTVYFQLRQIGENKKISNKSLSENLRWSNDSFNVTEHLNYNASVKTLVNKKIKPFSPHYSFLG